MCKAIKKAMYSVEANTLRKYARFMAKRAKKAGDCASTKKWNDVAYKGDVTIELLNSW